MRELTVYNTLSRKKEVFKPVTPGQVKMYVCGITPYNHSHMGNARPFVTWDVIKRYLKHLGYAVTHIQNFTDVDDKIINAANGEEVSWDTIANRYIASYFEVMDKLHIQRADKYPRVSEHMDDIIAMISKLIENGHAYELDGDVYYRVQSFEHYGELSHRSLEDMMAGARIEVDDRKENPMDFALWKAAKPGEPSWDSPWGPGRPGWHIECSVMSTGILGDTIDIHGGGADLEFPHHTNEIAQSEAKTGQTFANYWMHNGFVNIDNVKMSKSLGNFITVHDALKTIDGQVLRFFFATQHYRKPINFTEKAVRDAETNLKYLKNTYEQPFTGEVDPADLQGFVDKFIVAMDEDINAANGITVVFELAKWINSGHYNQDVKDALTKMLEVFGVVFVEEVLDADIEALIAERQEARAKKDFARADAIRDELAAQGIKLLDTKEGVRWTRD